MKQAKIMIIIVGMLSLIWGLTVKAEGMEDTFLDEMDFGEINDTLDELLGDQSFSFGEAVGKLISGEMPFTWESIGQLVWDAMFSELDLHRKTAVQILILIIVAAIFMNFTNVFEKSQVADISFYIMYLLLFTILMKAFYNMSQIAEETLNNVLTFMKILMPSYFIAATFASGSLTGVAYYEFTLLLITLIQWLLKYAVLPAVNLYVLFLLLNHLSAKEYLSKMADLLKTFIEWSLKTLGAAAIGFQIVQSLILPALDSLKTAVVNKTAGAIPGVGNIFTGVAEVVLGSAVLIKNAIGAVGLIILVFICISPIVKLAVCVILYKVMAALIQPVSDKRMVECVGGVGEGAGMLLKIVLHIAILFFITVAMVTASIRGS